MTQTPKTKPMALSWMLLLFLCSAGLVVSILGCDDDCPVAEGEYEFLFKKSRGNAPESVRKQIRQEINNRSVTVDYGEDSCPQDLPVTITSFDPVTQCNISAYGLLTNLEEQGDVESVVMDVTLSGADCSEESDLELEVNVELYYAKDDDDDDWD